MTESIQRIATLGSVVLALAVLLVGANGTRADPRLTDSDFEPLAEQGFGDLHNSMAGSMAWWNDRLYVGTVRSNACTQRAIAQVLSPWMTYPPPDGNLQCAEDPRDLPLRAEIWTYAPDTDTWQRAFRAPELPIPGFPGKSVGRDIGYRDMQLFEETDGTIALYVAGFTSRELNPVPGPRLLRSTDGVNFEPVPHDPGTFLGGLDRLNGVKVSGFNRLAVYKDRLYLTIGGAYGHGTLVSAAEPQLGNNAFQPVMGPGKLVTDMIVFNDQLYVATGAPPGPGSPAYEILRTDATGEPPYAFVPVVENGGHRSSPSTTVAHMEVHNGRLYAGTNQPTELIRIDPDDSWDLLGGKARVTLSPGAPVEVG